MGYLFNGVEDGGCPFALVKRVIEGFNVPYFIETGTAGGHSITRAAEIFAECHTIELVAGVTPLTRSAILKYTDVRGIDREQSTTMPIEYAKNIKFHIGNSPDILMNLLKGKENEYIVFWLDAHYSAPEPSPDNCVECPLLQELEKIKVCAKPIIFIDDARLFLGTPPPPHKPAHWAGISDVFKNIQQNFPQHHFTIVDDYILIIPMEMKENLSREWVERFKIRYADLPQVK